MFRCGCFSNTFYFEKNMDIEKLIVLPLRTFSYLTTTSPALIQSTYNTEI